MHVLKNDHQGRDMIDHHRALIYTMVLASASDGDMTDNELHTISENVRFLPAFRGFDVEELTEVATECTELLGDPEGLEKTLAAIKLSLTKSLRETAYMLACEVVASDARASQEELRMLELIRHGLDIDRLTAAALERGARARHVTGG
ncbi:tellurite resistance TerB family protein [Aerophototrophica crusticola]